MMYGNKLAAAIKVNGKILREFKDTVYIPFGCEYEILVKNLNSARAVVNIFVDGDNVVPGGLVVDAGREVTLERSIKGGNLTEGNKFKFIERTSNIENHRGIKVEDGLIRIEYQFEQPRPIFRIADLPQWQQNDIWNGIKHSNLSGSTSEYKGVTDKFSVTSSGSTTQMNVSGALRGIDYSNGESTKAAATSAINSYCALNNINVTSQVHDGMATMDSFQNDVGITVPGSKSEQKFQNTYVGTLESTKHNLVFKLAGDLGVNKPVDKPVTVKHKPKCVTCGKQNKAHAKFCSECGTALEIFA